MSTDSGSIPVAGPILADGVLLIGGIVGAFTAERIYDDVPPWRSRAVSAESIWMAQACSAVIET